MQGKPVKLVSKQLLEVMLEAMLETAEAAIAGTDLLLVAPIALGWCAQPQGRVCAAG
jgi:hypothetical protein